MRLLISRHLENFLALCETGNMHSAAARKGISQPALTKSLKVLEDDLGTDLFVRTHKGVDLTDAGQRLYRYARAIDQEARFASMDIHDMHRNLGGRIRIGIGPVLALSSFPAVLVDFYREFPSLEVTVETGISSQLVAELVRDKLDLIITARPELPLPDQYSHLPLIKSQMVVICRDNHPLSHREKVKLDDLMEFGRAGFIEDLEFERNSKRALGSRAEHLRPVLQTTSLSVMFGVLAATDYFAIVSNILLPRAKRERLRPLPVDHQLWRIQIELMCKSSLMGSRPVATIKNGLLAHT